MSVASEILRIQHNIANAYAAVSQKGGEVPLQPTSANLAASIATISGDSGSSSGGVPIGTIVIWSGTSEDIPSGWALCDGQDGRPDLRDKFVLGAGTTHTVGDSGGEETCTLTVEEMPEHSHVFGMTADPKKVQESGSIFNASLIYNSKDDTAISKTGGSQPHNNMPPYYALCYIIKTEEDSGSGGGAGGESAGEIYSTEETRIGTWVDGKPVYRKTLDITIGYANGAWYPIPSTIEMNIDAIVDLRGFVNATDGSGKIYALNAESYFKLMNDSLCFSGNANQTNTDMVLTIEYTKTTD